MFIKIVAMLLFVEIHSKRNYKFRIDHALVNSNNPEWGEAHVRNTFYNRTTRTIDVTFKFMKDIEELEGSFKTYRFYNNYYQEYAHLNIVLDTCLAFRNNFLGFGDMLKLGNLTNCPIKKGFYYIKNYAPTAEQFPPYLPAGKYILRTYMTTQKILITDISWYTEIQKIFN